MKKPNITREDIAPLAKAGLAGAMDALRQSFQELNIAMAEKLVVDIGVVAYYCRKFKIRG